MVINISSTKVAILVFLVCFLLIFSFIFTNINSIDAVEGDNVYGWAWTENFGWISLNCFNYYNDVLTNNCASAGNADYGLNVNQSDGIISGYAWSEHAGWVDFNPMGPYPELPDHGAKLGSDGLITGWARVINQAPEGWISFRGQACDEAGAACALSGTPPYSAPYSLNNTPLDGQSSLCYNCNRYKRSCNGGDDPGAPCDSDNDCLGKAPTPDGTCNGNFILDPKGEIKCSFCYTEHQPVICQEPDCLNNEKYGSGSICAVDSEMPKNQEYLCYNCSEYYNSQPFEDLKIITCEKCPKCYEYGVAVDYATNRLMGWGWQAGSNGVGWIQFHATKTVIEGPWLESLLGGIYAIGSVGSPFTYSPPETQFSATYEIQAKGTITHFVTKGGEAWTEESFEDLQFPDISQAYTNALGRIDFSGIYAGQYGKVEEITQQSEINSILGGKIYRVKGDLDINSTLTFDIGNLNTPDGAGLIIVEGDLNINANIRYNLSPIQRIKNLPSVGWIIKGDVNVNQTVNEIAGAFIVIGDGDPESCPILGTPSLGCGRFSSGSSKTMLDVSGLIMAKQFDFARTYYSPQRGAERVVYDARAIVNTPPGMEDITLVLPIWREIAP